ncbi:MAG: hypothetical protein RL518_2266 [Pseudomonadota bacterium]|jgi:hypothetical protein
MFRIDQIMVAIQFVRSFRAIGALVSCNPEPLLISQKIGAGLIVAMDGEFFEGLMDGAAQLTQVRARVHAPHASDLKSEIHRISPRGL